MAECPLTGANRALTTASSQNNQPVLQTAKRVLRACTTLQEQWSTQNKGYGNGGKQLLMLSVEKCGKNSSYRREGLWLRRLNPSAPGLILQIKSRKLFVTLPNLNLCKVRSRTIIALSLRSPHKGNNSQCRGQPGGFSKALDCSSVGIKHSHKTCLPKTADMPFAATYRGKAHPFPHMCRICCVLEKVRGHITGSNPKCDAPVFLINGSSSTRGEKKPRNIMNSDASLANFNIFSVCD